MKILQNEEYMYLSGGFESYDYDINPDIELELNHEKIYKSISIAEDGILILTITKKQLHEYLEINGEISGLDYIIIENLAELITLKDFNLKKEIMEILCSKRDKRRNESYLDCYLYEK